MVAENDNDDLLFAQRELAQLALDAIGVDGFALAGSGAIREHGIIDRSTEDVDLFGVFERTPSQDDFSRSASCLERALNDAGLSFSLRREAPFFRSYDVVKGDLVIGIDLALDYRTEPPAHLSVGPTLSLKDAVASKVAAIFSRGEARDFLDLDKIRESSGYDDDELLELARDVDAGITKETFASSLRTCASIPDASFAPYGISSAEANEMKGRIAQWADKITRDFKQTRTGLSIREIGEHERAASKALNAQRPPIRQERER